MLTAIKHCAPYITFREWSKSLKRQAKLHRYRGTDHRCPICDVRLRAFKPVWKSYWRALEDYGWVYPASALETFNVEAYSCPKCDAFDRERLMAIYLEHAFRSLDPTRRYRLIEFSPAHALHKAIARYPFIEYRSADLTRNDVQDCVDLTDIRPYGSDSVDIFLCSHILEHIPDDRRAMRELYRILKPGGFGIVLVPLIPGVDQTHEDPQIDTLELRWKYFGGGDHVRQYGKRDFLDRLSAAGFTVDQLGIGHFGAEAFRLHGIAEDSVLYLLRKPDASSRSGPLAK